jgi:hypothetical protein
LLLPAVCPRLCLALPWHRRRRCGAGALAPPAPAITRGLPAPPRTAPPIRHGAAMRMCGPARLWTSVAGTARAARARSCLVELAWAGASPGGEAPPDPCQPKRIVGRLVFYCRAVCRAGTGSGRVLPPLSARPDAGVKAAVPGPWQPQNGCRLLRRFSSSSRSAM